MAPALYALCCPSGVAARLPIASAARAAARLLLECSSDTSSGTAPDLTSGATCSVTDAIEARAAAACS